MNAAAVSRVLSLIPERSARVPSGAAFQAQSSACSHPERLAQLSRFLTWLSPLGCLTREEQTALGLLAANGRPAQASDEDDGEDLGDEVELEAAL